MTEIAFGTYVGRITHLRGERAMILPYWPYRPNSGARWFQPRGLTIHEEVVFVQFNNMKARRRSYRQHQMQPTTEKKHLGTRWHCFRETDFRMDPPHVDPMQQKFDALRTRAKTSPASPG